MNNKQVIQPRLEEDDAEATNQCLFCGNNLSLRVACGSADKEGYSEVLQE